MLYVKILKEPNTWSTWKESKFMALYHSPMLTESSTSAPMLRYPGAEEQERRGGKFVHFSQSEALPREAEIFVHADRQAPTPHINHQQMHKRHTKKNKDTEVRWRYVRPSISNVSTTYPPLSWEQRETRLPAQSVKRPGGMQLSLLLCNKTDTRPSSDLKRK